MSLFQLPLYIHTHIQYFSHLYWITGYSGFAMIWVSCPLNSYRVLHFRTALIVSNLNHYKENFSKAPWSCWRQNFKFYSVPMPPVVSLEDKDYSLVSQNIVHENSFKVPSKTDLLWHPACDPQMPSCSLSLGHCWDVVTTKLTCFCWLLSTLTCLLSLELWLIAITQYKYYEKKHYWYFKMQTAYP